MAPDCEFVGAGMRLDGRERVRQVVAGFRTGFPDVQHTLRAMAEDGDHGAATPAGSVVGSWRSR